MSGQRKHTRSTRHLGRVAYTLDRLKRGLYTVALGAKEVGLRGDGRDGGSRAISGSWDCVKLIARTEGILGFYRGIGPTFFRLAPHTIVLWVAQAQYIELLGSCT